MRVSRRTQGSKKPKQKKGLKKGVVKRATKKGLRVRRMSKKRMRGGGLFPQNVIKTGTRIFAIGVVSCLFAAGGAGGIYYLYPGLKDALPLFIEAIKTTIQASGEFFKDSWVDDLKICLTQLKDFISNWLTSTSTCRASVGVVATSMGIASLFKINSFVRALDITTRAVSATASFTGRAAASTAEAATSAATGAFSFAKGMVWGTNMDSIKDMFIWAVTKFEKLFLPVFEKMNEMAGVAGTQTMEGVGASAEVGMAMFRGVAAGSTGVLNAALSKLEELIHAQAAMQTADAIRDGNRVEGRAVIRDKSPPRISNSRDDDLRDDRSPRDRVVLLLERVNSSEGECVEGGQRTEDDLNHIAEESGGDVITQDEARKIDDFLRSL